MVSALPGKPKLRTVTLNLGDTRDRIHPQHGIVRARRSELGNSQVQLAGNLQIADLEMTQATVPEIEHGTRHVYDFKVSAIADALMVG
ncbi:MAG: helix-turn-helix transcriptional regulator [Dehalococcoidia bacterium]|jgi:hypothetical protein|nr:helix-turn-helix transcriptional regulator [Dehalococcoidia bacterium]